MNLNGFPQNGHVGTSAAAAGGPLVLGGEEVIKLGPDEADGGPDNCAAKPPTGGPLVAEGGPVGNFTFFFLFLGSKPLTVPAGTPELTALLLKKYDMIPKNNENTSNNTLIKRIQPQMFIVFVGSTIIACTKFSIS